MKRLTDLMSKTGKWLLVFGILFSQLSFPLSVFADEVINDGETTEEEQAISAEDSISLLDEIVDSTDDMMDEKAKEKTEENEVTDINEQKTFGEDVVSDEKVDSNESDENGSENTETPEEPVVPENPETPEEPDTPIDHDLVKIEWKDELCVVRSTLMTPVTLERLSSEVEGIVKVIDKDGLEIEFTQEIYTGYQLVVMKEDTEVISTIVILGDYDDNGVVNTDDQQALLEAIQKNDDVSEVMNVVDLNGDGEFNILDVTYPIFTTGTWETEVEASDVLEHYLTLEGTKTEFYVGEEIEFGYYIENFQVDVLKGIEGILDYDRDLLELTSVTVNQVEQELSTIENGKFAYLLEDYLDSGVLITFTFVAKEIGTPNVMIDQVISSLGGVKANLNGVTASTSTNIVEEDAKGGDDDTGSIVDSTPTVPTTSVVSSEQIQTTTPVVTTTNYVVKRLALSTDNYIKSLEIVGHKIDFDMYTYEYAITVKNSVNSLDLNVVLNSDSSSYYVEGNSDFKVGENTVNIIVKSEDGSSRTYTIKVNKEKAKKTAKKDTSEEKEEENSSSRTVIIILIVLVIIGLVYVIFKDDEEDQKESKK